MLKVRYSFTVLQGYDQVVAVNAERPVPEGEDPLDYLRECFSQDIRRQLGESVARAGALSLPALPAPE